MSKMLSIEVEADPEESYKIDDSEFVKGNVAIHTSGIAIQDNPKIFSINYDDLELSSDLLGRGSSGIVVKATHVPSNTPLALKIINMYEKAKRDSIMREIQTLYDADCPSIVTFYGAFLREGTINIALEYMDGGSLANVLHQVGPIPENALANMTFQILWALAYMKHDKRVHRDIKPSNLLINSIGEVKVTDFGITASLSNSIAMCQTFVGTFKYMSPERIKNEPYSYASDIWSLGLVLIECATGIYPYPVRGACIDMVQTMLEMDPPTLPDSGYSDEFHDFLRQCLQKDPNRRLPAEILLGSPWIMANGATAFDECVENVRLWIESVTM